ncbi:hypothetical protein L2750_02915 [Shewanella submarina]|uniref:Uncharacterized protein n=1 Tax=Shewanella submarina TaxID=2016376 RepID=A0ABV7GJH3_9GAMM|nr:hypothetical protein [Shewanella submarina]MCL1036107.1 hypothetical protein [Shewanella submarina]
MSINATFLGQLIILNALILIPLTWWFARGKTRQLVSTVFMAVILSIIFFPLGWLYCGYWSMKSPSPEVQG